MISTEEDIRYWLALTAVPNIGVQTLLRSAHKSGSSLSKLRELGFQQLEQLGWNTKQIACLHEAHPFTTRCVTWLHQGPRRSIITYDCQAYPAQLKQISQAPLMLFADGDHELLSKMQLAVVGSRGPTHSGLRNTQALIADLVSQADVVITSGLALGIDAQSHDTALQLNAKTIGVLGNGIDVIYPKRHAKLYEQVREKGLLLSEFPPSVLPSPALFPRRNRIISGLSLGTLVTEARIKSGSLVTAKYALEQDREIFAVPSAINNKQASGCHWLIKQGAKLTECAQDILDELPQLPLKSAQKQVPEKKPKQSLATSTLLDSVGITSNQNNSSNTASQLFAGGKQEDEKDDSSMVLQAIDFEVTPIDVIAMRTGRSISTLLIQLLEYELRGFVASTSEGYLKLRD